MRRFLLTVAAIVAITSTTQAQVEPAGGSKKEAPHVVTVSVTLPALPTDLPLAGDCTFPKGAVFPVQILVPEATDATGAKFENQMIEANEPLAETIKVKGLTRLPAKTVPRPGMVLTLAPGAKLPEQPKPPVPPKEPERIKVGLRNVTEDQLAADEKLQAKKIFDLEKRLMKAEKAILEIQKQLTPDEKAGRLKAQFTGTYYYSCNDELVAKREDSDPGEVRIQKVGYDSGRRQFVYAILK